MTYAKIISETIIDRNPPRRATINGREVTGELPADYLATLGYLPFDETPMPSVEPAQGKHWEPRYAEVEGRVVQSWTQVDDPAPAPRTFSKLKIVAALTTAGVWPQVKAFIEQAGLYDLYLAAQDFAEDNEYFTQGRQQLQTALGWTDEQVEAVLAQAVI